MFGPTSQMIMTFALGICSVGQAPMPQKTPGSSTGAQVPPKIAASPAPVAVAGTSTTPAVEALMGNSCVSQSTCCCEECKYWMIKVPKLFCFNNGCAKEKSCGHKHQAGCGDCDCGCDKCKCANGKVEYRDTSRCCKEKCKSNFDFHLGDTKLGCAAHAVGFNIARSFWQIGDCCSCCDNCGNGANKTIVALKPVGDGCCKFPQPEPCCCKPKCEKPCGKSGCSTCSKGCETAPAAGCATCAKMPVTANAVVAKSSGKQEKRSVFAPKAVYATTTPNASPTTKTWSAAKPKETQATSNPTSSESAPVKTIIVRTSGESSSSQVATASRIPTTVQNPAVAPANVKTIVPVMPDAIVQQPVATSATTAPAFATHAPDYSWLHGKLEKSTARGGAWIVRYGAPAENDPNGGMVVLAYDRKLRTFKAGDIVRVEGSVVGPEMKAVLGGPLYKIRKIERTQ